MRGAVAISPDGQYVAMGSGTILGNKSNVKVFQVAQDKEIIRLIIDGAVRDIVFSPDGHQLKTIAIGDKVSIGNHLLKADDLIAETCSRLNRNLTVDEWIQYVGNIPYKKTCDNLL